MKKIILGMSGGVDSSVCAYLLKEQGYHVEGLFMKNWEETNNLYCTSSADLLDAQSVCHQLNINLHTVDFSKEYWDNVFSYFLNNLKQGLTPNPDVLCNTEIKFKCFLKHAQNLQADFIATGHYAVIKKNNEQYSLNMAKDNTKDQTYFLHGLSQYQLKNSLYPLGDYTKQEVRKIAKKIGLKNANKADSTGICFIGERKFKQFISQYLPATPGDIITTNKQVIGAHAGVIYYTIGQRQGLNIGGTATGNGEPWYVIDKNIKTNQLTVVQGSQHPLLYQNNLMTNLVHWIESPPTIPFQCYAKTRYRQKEQLCWVSANQDKSLKVEFKNKQRAITPGQYIVFYHEKKCLGGGTIKETTIRSSTHDNL